MARVGPGTAGVPVEPNTHMQKDGNMVALGCSGSRRS